MFLDPHAPFSADTLAFIAFEKPYICVSLDVGIVLKSPISNGNFDNEPPDPIPQSKKSSPSSSLGILPRLAREETIDHYQHGSKVVAWLTVPVNLLGAEVICHLGILVE